VIKFAGSDEQTGWPVLGIGLTAENCRRLLKGEPIFFETAGMDGLPAIHVFLLAGETDEAIAFEMLKTGALTVDRIREDPSLADSHATEEVN
jgi:hypothetical protein